MQTKMEYGVISARVERVLISRLDQLSERRGISRSDLIREIILKGVSGFPDEQTQVTPVGEVQS